MTPPRSLAEAVRERAEQHGDRELVRLAGEPGLTAATVWDQAVTIARGLARRVGPGDAVATALEPGPRAIAVSTALSLLGAVEVALAEGMDCVWADRLARSSSSVLVIADPTRAAEPALASLGDLSPLGIVHTDRAPGSDAVSLDDLSDSPSTLPRHEPSLGSPALVMPTSGTTGKAKAAMLPNGAGLGQARRVQRAMGYSSADAIYSFFPWQHINARHASFLPAVLSGARLVISPRFSATSFWSTVTAEGVTAFNFMGAVCAILLRQPPGPHDRGHAVTRAYGGPAPDWLVTEMAARFDVQLRQAYACTELGDVATTGAQIRPGAAGRPVGEYDVRVLRPDGGDAPAGETGELVVRPREENLTFTGYVADPAATDHAWRGGWFHTGDQVRLDRGWLYYEGRSADVIRRRGLNISAAAVEDAVATLPDVAEVAAVGVPSELTEDDVLVVVVPAGKTLDPAAVIRHCRTLLPRHAVPRFVSIEPALPRNASHKVLRAQLRDRGVPTSSWDAEASRTFDPVEPS